MTTVHPGAMHIGWSVSFLRIRLSSTFVQTLIKKSGPKRPQRSWDLDQGPLTSKYWLPHHTWVTHWPRYNVILDMMVYHTTLCGLPDKVWPGLIPYYTTPYLSNPDITWYYTWRYIIPHCVVYQIRCGLVLSHAGCGCAGPLWLTAAPGAPAVPRPAFVCELKSEINLFSIRKICDFQLTEYISR